jgi:hypothetical protein
MVQQPRGRFRPSRSPSMAPLQHRRCRMRRRPCIRKRQREAGSPAVLAPGCGLQDLEPRAAQGRALRSHLRRTLVNLASGANTTAGVAALLNSGIGSIARPISSRQFRRTRRLDRGHRRYPLKWRNEPGPLSSRPNRARRPASPPSPHTRTS